MDCFTVPENIEHTDAPKSQPSTGVFPTAAWPQVIASNWTSSKAPAGSSDGNLRHFAILKPSSVKPDFWILESMTGWWFQTFFSIMYIICIYILYVYIIYIYILIYGMSSFPLTNSIIFQDGYCTTNQMIWGFFWGYRVRAATWELHDERWAGPQVQGGLAGLGLLDSRKPQSWVILRITGYNDCHNIQSIFWPWRKSQSPSSSSSSSFSENVHHYCLLREVNTCPFAVQVAAKAIWAGQGVARSGCLKAQRQPEAKFSWGVGIGVTLARYLRTGTRQVSACQGFWVNSTSGPQKGYAAEPPSFWSFLLKEDDLIWLSEFSG